MSNSATSCSIQTGIIGFRLYGFTVYERLDDSSSLCVSPFVVLCQKSTFDNFIPSSVSPDSQRSLIVIFTDRKAKGKRASVYIDLTHIDVDPEYNDLREIQSKISRSSNAGTQASPSPHVANTINREKSLARWLPLIAFLVLVPVLILSHREYPALWNKSKNEIGLEAQLLPLVTRSDYPARRNKSNDDIGLEAHGLLTVNGALSTVDEQLPSAESHLPAVMTLPTMAAEPPTVTVDPPPASSWFWSRWFNRTDPRHGRNCSVPFRSGILLVVPRCPISFWTGIYLVSPRQPCAQTLNEMATTSADDVTSTLAEAREQLGFDAFQLVCAPLIECGAARILF
jgi:hypothetical protein